MNRRLVAIARSVVADARRRKIVVVTLLFAAVMTAAIPLLPSYGAGVAEAVYREVALSLAFIAGVIVALGLSANRVPGEVERRTIYNVLSRPVRRWEYLLGSWLGVSLTLLGVFAVFGSTIFIIGWLVYGVPMWVLWQGIAAIWLEACVVSAFAVAVSTRMGPVVVTTATLVFLFIAHARSALFAPGDIGWSLYPSLDAFNIINPVAHGSGVSVGYALTTLLVFVGWSAALMVIGAAAFDRRDL